MWKHYGNTGFHVKISTTASNNEGPDNTPAVDYNRWYDISYDKQGQVLTVYYDGAVVH